MEGIGLIVILALTGGAIAYIGDRLGTRIGKRKLTVFGLRPRHTSTLITIVSGFMIVAATMGTLAVVSNDVRTALFGMEKLKVELLNLSQDVLNKNQELEKSHAELKAKTEEYQQLMAKIKETTDRLKAVSTELLAVQKQRDQIEAELATARDDMAKLAAEKTQLEARLAELTETKNTLEAEAAKLQETTESLRQGIRAVREGNIAVRSGELLGSTVVDSRIAQDEQENQMRQLLAETNHKLIQRLEINRQDAEILWLAQGEFDRISKQIHDNPDSYLLRIVAAGNIVYGEPVIAGFELYRNRLVYRAGANVYSQLVNVGKDRDASEALLFFLRQVNNEAIKQGVLPDPLRGTVGIMDGMLYYDTVAQMNQVGGGGAQLRLTAMAVDDVYTAGPLRLKFRVEKVN